MKETGFKFLKVRRFLLIAGPMLEASVKAMEVSIRSFWETYIITVAGVYVSRSPYAVEACCFQVSGFFDQSHSGHRVCDTVLPNGDKLDPFLLKKGGG